MNDITLTLPQRAYDGLVEAAHRNGLTVEELALQFVESAGFNYANLFKIGLLTSAAFVQRFSAQEYGAILAAADQNQQIGGLVMELINSPFVALDDPRLPPGLALLVSAGLLAPDRPEEILYYERP